MRALKSDCRPFPSTTARNRIRDMRNPLKIESAFWVTFWVSLDFVSLLLFRSAPDSGGQEKNKNPPTIRVKGFGIGRSGGI